ncbi:F-box domain-containing protein [Mycena venus]|uniref:F-box domain-containing protein n=1 Tax=Mycena venus TaxID=2733690 RepID=A0A8H6Y5Q9_9AGAR|nr:F-box domain-containing protein [Mycena venus]
MPTIDLRRRLAGLDAQIEEQRRVLAELERNRAAVERELFATAVYPVLTLPAEIPAEIFHHCLPPVHDLRSGEMAPPILRIMAVCRMWRDIAHATPTLWSTLRVPFDSILPDAAAVEGLVEGFIDHWLARAGNCPLSLIFDVGRAERFALSRLRDVIHSYSHQVRYLDVDVGGRDIRELELDSAIFPLLQAATLRCRYINPPGRFFRNAPHFHDLRLLSHPTNRLNLPWWQLTKFEGTIWNLELFTLATNLTEVTCTKADFVPPPSPVVHDRLRSLTLMGPGMLALRYLDLPALKYLDVSEMDTHTSLEPFLIRSSPPLVFLTVPGDQSCFADWHQCLPLVGGSLETLKLKFPSSAVMSSILSTWSGDQNLSSLRNLQTVCFEYIQGGIDFFKLVDFLYSRSSTLRSCRLLWRPDFFLDSKYLAGSGNIKADDTVGGHLSQLCSALTLVQEGSVAPETYQKQVRTLDIDLAENVSALQEEVGQLRGALEGLWTERSVVEQGARVAQPREVNNALSAKLALAEQEELADG